MPHTSLTCVIQLNKLEHNDVLFDDCINGCVVCLNSNVRCLNVHRVYLNVYPTLIHRMQIYASHISMYVTTCWQLNMLVYVKSQSTSCISQCTVHFETSTVRIRGACLNICGDVSIEHVALFTYCGVCLQMNACERWLRAQNT